MLLAGIAMPAGAVGSQAKMLANPIRKVVTMMTNMQKKIEAEGKTKEEMFEKFMCYCKNSDSSLAASISAAEEKIPQLESSIKESSGMKAQLEADVKQANSDRAEAVSTLAKAKSIREKEASAFASEAAETKTNINALSKAIPAIEQGMSASFLQENTGITQKLRQLSVSMDMETVDRDLLASFLSGGSSSKGSGEILGILKQMKEEMSKDLADATADENGKIADFEALTAAKGKEKAALTKAIETKTVRVGELSVGVAETSNDLEDTTENLAEDKKMFANLDKDCATKAKEYEEFKKVQAAELVALADTIKLLNDDDALDLFKKTLPSSASSFMQVQVTAKSMQQRALSLLKAARRHRGHGADPRIDFLELALHGKNVGFEKIIKMVDDLMTALKTEQADDDSKKSYCLAEFDKQEDIKKGLVLDISDLGKAIDDGEETMKTLTKEIASLTAGIKDLDKSVAEATSTRKEENADYTKTLAENGAAKDLLGLAKNRLNKFYNPKMYKAPPKRELSEEERITVNMGGTLAPTAAPGGIAGTDIMAASFMQVESHMTFKKKTEESTGVIAMIDLLIADLDKDIQVMEMTEKDAQSDYESFMSDAKTKRALDAKSITDKESAKAEAESETEKSKMAKKGKKVEAMETDKYISGLHAECDFTLKFYDTRKEARADEIDALDKAKAVLNGADYSFIQTGSLHLRGSK